MAADPPLIEYRNVTVKRGERVALEDVSLAIGAGEHVAILGPNGSGKSTLIKTITRDLYPLQREDSFLRILGRDRWNIFDLRPLLGIVSQDLIQSCARPYYSGREIVLSGFFGSIGIWPNHHVTGEMERRVNELMEGLGIAYLADRNAEEMSTGESRRLVIARALVHQPRALVLDEPTNSLDFHAMHALRVTLSGIARLGIGLILVTHHLDDIVPEVTRAVLLSRGRIVGDGQKAEMLTPARLSPVFEIPVEVEERNGYYHLW